MTTTTIPEFVVTMTRVTNKTRCPRDYQLGMTCPHCGTLRQVGHMCWSAIYCPGCDTGVPKTEWLIPNPKLPRKTRVNDYFLNVVLPTCRPLLGKCYINDQHMWEAFLYRLVEEGKLQENVMSRWIAKYPKAAK